MFKDDRMMSMLTFTLVMLLIGTFLHRSDFVSDLLNGGSAKFELRRDEVTVPANKLTSIDVLENDTGLRSGDSEALQITRQPACGRVFVRWGAVHYLPAERCAGSQNFGYTIAGRGEAEGEVIAQVVIEDAAGDGTGKTPAPAPAPAPEPMASAPQQTPQQPAAPQVTLPRAGASGAGPDAPQAVAARPPTAAPADPGASAERAAAVNGTAASPPRSPATAIEGAAAGQAATPDTPVAAAPAPPQTPEAPCTAPPSLTVDVRRGALTTVSVEAPCDAGRTARLDYDSLEFGLALDGSGRGSVTVPGLQPSSDAQLRLPSGDGLAFDLPFADTGRLDRVAIVWDAPVRLDLHALEFGARPGGGGHVSPDQPRSFAAVRRHGGGYLTTYDPLGGTGQHINVYSYWRRPGSATGVIKLKVDFVSRTGGGQSATCGTGDLARPEFRVLRMQAGQLARPELRRLAPLDCAAVAQVDRLIGGAVDDILVLRK